jgi:flagellar hook-associated protein FlgK
VDKEFNEKRLNNGKTTIDEYYGNLVFVEELGKGAFGTV